MRRTCLAAGLLLLTAPVLGSSQVHLSPGRSPSEMVISWASDPSLFGAGPSVVDFVAFSGPDSGRSQRREGTSSLFRASASHSILLHKARAPAQATLPVSLLCTP